MRKPVKSLECDKLDKKSRDKLTKHKGLKPLPCPPCNRVLESSEVGGTQHMSGLVDKEIVIAFKGSIGWVLML